MENPSFFYTCVGGKIAASSSGKSLEILAVGLALYVGLALCERYAKIASVPSTGSRIVEPLDTGVPRARRDSLLEKFRMYQAGGPSCEKPSRCRSSQSQICSMPPISRVPGFPISPNGLFARKWSKSKDRSCDVDMLGIGSTIAGIDWQTYSTGGGTAAGTLTGGEIDGVGTIELFCF